MKIAIMTQPLGKNYGGIMQAFALQKILKDMHHEVVTIDYNAKQANFFYKKARLPYRLVKKVIGKRKAPINMEKNIRFITQNNKNFIDSNILQSEYIDTSNSLRKHFRKNKYDAVIVGSDQTWRPKYSPNIYNFYLQFLKAKNNIKRIAYASSLGVDEWEYSVEETKKCAKLAASFDAISVREQSGIELCKEHLGVDSTCTLDPTLLLDKEEYIVLMSEHCKKESSEGVYTYFLDSNKDKISAAQYLADALDTYTYNCQAKCSLSNLNSSELEDYKMPAVQDWLTSFYNAEFVLTDSFHGMVFSIIFNKPFLVIVNKERGAARFESLLNQIGGLKHLIYNSTEIENNISEIKNITPLEINELNILKEHSIKFLKDNL